MLDQDMVSLSLFHAGHGTKPSNNHLGTDLDFIFITAETLFMKNGASEVEAWENQYFLF